MSLQNELRDTMERGDADHLAVLWRLISPMSLQPDGEHQKLIMFHGARSQTHGVSLKKRQYSDEWLRERGIESGLHPRLRRARDRFEPRVVSAVGIAVKPKSESSRELASAVHNAMRDAVAEMYSDGITDPTVVSARMQEARIKVLRHDGA